MSGSGGMIGRYRSQKSLRAIIADEIAKSGGEGEITKELLLQSAVGSRANFEIGYTFPNATLHANCLEYGRDGIFRTLRWEYVFTYGQSGLGTLPDPGDTCFALMMGDVQFGSGSFAFNLVAGQGPNFPTYLTMTTDGGAKIRLRDYGGVEWRVGGNTDRPVLSNNTKIMDYRFEGNSDFPEGPSITARWSYTAYY